MTLKNVFKRLGIALLLSFILLSSCARTVTSRDTLLRLRVTLNFAGQVAPDSYNYFIVIGQSAPILPAVPPYEYFPTPGLAYDQTNQDITNNDGDILFYYQSFFDSWSDYYVLRNGNTFEQYASGSSGFPNDIDTPEEHTNDFPPVQNLQIEDLTFSGTQIQFTIFTQDLSTNASTIFINAFTTKQLDTQTGVLQDVLLDAQDVSILLRSNEQIQNSFSDSEEHINNSAVDAAADFTTWELVVF